MKVADSVDEMIDWALERERDFAELEPGSRGADRRAPDRHAGATNVIMLRESRSRRPRRRASGACPR
jgi:hypothetical protein